MFNVVNNADQTAAELSSTVKDQQKELLSAVASSAELEAKLIATNER